MRRTLPLGQRKSYSYHAASNRTGFTDPESGATAYAYDTLNRLQTLTPPSAFTAGSFGFGYDALSRRTQMTRPNNVTTNYGYDNLSRLLSVLHQVSNDSVRGARDRSTTHIDKIAENVPSVPMFPKFPRNHVPEPTMCPG